MSNVFESYEAVKTAGGVLAAPPSREAKARCTRCVSWTTTDEHGTTTHKMRCWHSRSLVDLIAALRRRKLDEQA